MVDIRGMVCANRQLSMRMGYTVIASHGLHQSGHFFPDMDGSSARLPYVTLLSRQYYRRSSASGATVSHPPATHELHIPSCPPTYSHFNTTYFVFFAPDDSIADLVNLSALLCSDLVYFFRSNKSWKIITMLDTRVTSVIETYPTTPP
jgi:hypothetical protein